ncbi:MAG: putative transposase [Candidatus Omnitrophota bacterium]|jgi:putative transposase
MSNHVHFIVVPKQKESLSKTFKDAHMRYAQYIHKRKKLTGHFWSGRFVSSAMDEAYAYEAIRYVENNPVAAVGWSIGRRSGLGQALGRT